MMEEDDDNGDKDNDVVLKSYPSPIQQQQEIGLNNRHNPLQTPHLDLQTTPRHLLYSTPKPYSYHHHSNKSDTTLINHDTIVSASDSTRSNACHSANDSIAGISSCCTKPGLDSDGANIVGNIGSSTAAAGFIVGDYCVGDSINGIVGGNSASCSSGSSTGSSAIASPSTNDVPYNILGVPVYFPAGRKPFPAQLAVTSKVLTALSKNCNALLESPTGTGKTLALLTSTLAWQKKTLQTTTRRHPIYYCSRTHSQLKQVINELRNCHSVYSTTVHSSTIASRTHLCINESVLAAAKKEKISIDEVCKGLSQPETPGNGFRHKCYLYHKADRVSSSLRTQGIWDIEDAVNTGNKQNGCPYFGARGTLETIPDIIFSPYNYLLEPSIRDSMKINLDGAIVIFDEGHNIEEVCRSAASGEVTLDILALVVIQLDRLSRNGSAAFSSLLLLLTGLHDWLKSVGRVLRDMASDTEGNSFHVNENIWDGNEILDIFEDEFGLTEDSLAVYLEHFRTVMAEQEDATARKEMSHRILPVYEQTQDETNSEKPVELLSAATLQVLSTMLTVFRFMLTGRRANANAYKAVVQLQSVANGSEKENLMLVFHCLSASVAFKDLAASTHSILITSGTLSPLDSFAGELGVPFPVRVEAGHVINLATQVKVLAVSSAWGDSLEGSYRNQGSSTYHHALGQCLLHTVQMTTGGVLVFFPSYRMLETLHNAWIHDGTMRSLEKAIGSSILCEPRDNKDLEKVLVRFYGLLDKDLVCTETTKYSRHTAVFFAVCRGKVSEGINFADHYARVVMVVGIPYPATTDPFVKLKRVYQDQLAAADPTKSTISGEGWYKLQAFRAINQSVGRCIRHRNDYGAILLLDPRFQHHHVKSSLSSWVRSAVVDLPCIGDALRPLQSFFDHFHANVKRDLELLQETEPTDPNLENLVSKDSITTPLLIPKVDPRLASYSILEGFRKMEALPKSSKKTDSTSAEISVAEIKCSESDSEHSNVVVIRNLKTRLQKVVRDIVHSAQHHWSLAVDQKSDSLLSLPWFRMKILKELCQDSTLQLIKLSGNDASSLPGNCLTELLEESDFVSVPNWHCVSGMKSLEVGGEQLLLMCTDKWLAEDCVVVRIAQVTKMPENVSMDFHPIMIAFQIVCIGNADDLLLLNSFWVHPFVFESVGMDLRSLKLDDAYNDAVVNVKVEQPIVSHLSSHNSSPEPFQQEFDYGNNVATTEKMIASVGIVDTGSECKSIEVIAGAELQRFLESTIKSDLSPSAGKINTRPRNTRKDEKKSSAQMAPSMVSEELSSLDGSRDVNAVGSSTSASKKKPRALRQDIQNSERYSSLADFDDDSSDDFETVASKSVAKKRVKP